MLHRLLLVPVLVVVAAGVAPAADTPMTFEIYADKADDFRWRLKDGDGTIVATSGQGYKEKKSCADMLANLTKDVSKYEFELYEDAKKETRFRLKAKNGNVVGASAGGFKTKADAEKAVAAIQKGAKDAKTTDTTAK